MCWVVALQTHDVADQAACSLQPGLPALPSTQLIEQQEADAQRNDQRNHCVVSGPAVLNPAHQHLHAGHAGCHGSQA